MGTVPRLLVDPPIEGRIQQEDGADEDHVHQEHHGPQAQGRPPRCARETPNTGSGRKHPGPNRAEEGNRRESVLRSERRAPGSAAEEDAIGAAAVASDGEDG